MHESYSPILVSVYNRLDHLKQCVASLLNNEISKDSVLYVVSDAAYRPEDVDVIEHVRGYVKGIEGFKAVIPINREKNLGSVLSIRSAVNDVLDEHGRMIFLEDDNVVSSNFLQYINDGLNLYENDTKIFSVSGYNYPINIPESYPHDIYKWQGYSAWGAGTWKDRRDSIDWNCTGSKRVLKENKREMIRRIGENTYWQISYMVEQGLSWGDAVISYNMFVKDVYTIFPVVSKVRNIGHDGSGEHCGTGDRFIKQRLDPGIQVNLLQDLAPDESINKELRKYFKTPAKDKAIRVLSNSLPATTKNWVKKNIFHRS